MAESAMTLDRCARYVGTVSAIAIVYAASARLGLSLAFATQQVSAVWPPSGIALVALFCCGIRAWPGVYAGAFLINAASDEPLITAAGIAAGNTLEAVIGLLLLRRVIDFDGSLDKVKNVLGLVGLAAVVSTMVGATVGVANLWVEGIVPWAAYTSVWWVWWMGDAMGVVVVAPALLAWSVRPRWPWSGWKLVELGVLLLAVTVTSAFLFTGQLGAQQVFHLEYAVFPFFIWAALRFGPRETASLALIVTAIAVWGSVHESGPFATGTLDTRLLVLGSFMAVTCVSSMLLAAVTAERQAAQHRVQRAHDELEEQVEKRTAALAAANDELRQVNQALIERTAELARKNEEVEAFVYVVSHDLRAPLVNLHGFSDVLAASCEQLAHHVCGGEVPAATQAAVRPILDEEIPSALRYITASTSKFKRLIDALLKLSRTGRHDNPREPVDVQLLVATTLDSMRASIEKSQAAISVAQLPSATGDSTAIGQVFSNLIDNALKYLKTGRPGCIDIGGDRRDEAVHYWVRDNGSGFPTTAHGRQFQVFQRFHPTLAPGEGIGLAIVKRIVEGHGGKVWVESHDGLGSTFHFLLPAAPPAQHGAP